MEFLYGYRGYNGNMLDSYYSPMPIKYSNFDIRNESIDGQKYYVIRENLYEGNVYEDIWINKDTMQVSKIISETVGQTTIITNFTWILNNVTDEDMQIGNSNRAEIDAKLQKAVEVGPFAVWPIE